MARDNEQLTSDLASLKIDRVERPPSSSWKIFVWIGGLAAVAAVVVFVVVPFISSRVFKTEVSVTEISLVSPASSSTQMTASGYVVPQTTAKVTAKVAGRIAVMNFKENQTVKKGEIIAELDSTDLKAQILAAKATAAAAYARAETARATLGETTAQVDREKVLVEKGVDGKAALDDLVTHQRSLSQALSAAVADAEASQAQVKTLETNLESFTIVAPIDGTVVSKGASLGELVGPTSGPIVELADFASLEMEVDVPENRLHFIFAGSPAEIILDAFPDKVFTGSTAEIGSKVDRAKATLTVKVKFDGTPEDAKSDMSGRVNFLSKALDKEAAKQPPKLVVPGSALIDSNGEKAVFVVDGDKARRVPVVLGEQLGDGFVLKQGPAEGTKLVANPSKDLRDGQGIKQKD